MRTCFKNLNFIKYENLKENDDILGKYVYQS